MKKFLYLAAAAAAFLSVASCNKDMSSVSVPAGNATEIALRAGGALTKSAINGTAFPQGYDMVVSAYRNLGSVPGEDSAQDYFEGIRFGYDAVSGNWKSEQGAKYYPLDGTLDFLAVASAGYNDAATGIAPSAVWGESSNVAKKVVLTVPDNSGKFDDLLYSSANAEGLSASGTAMTFRHAMTSVVFLAKCNVAYNAGTNVGITVDGITIDGAKHSGTLTVSNPSAGGGSGDLSAAWSALGDQKTHVAARVWNASNTGILTNESALSGLNLTATSKSIASYPFGEGYVIMPEQASVPFTVTYTIHNGFASDGTTALSKQVQYQYTPEATTWEMGKKNIYEIEFTLTEIQIVPTVVDWDDNVLELVPIPAATAAATFGGLEIAAGPLYYNGTSYAMYDDWNHSSYESVYGKNSGSTYFNFIEMGKLFEKADFSGSDGDITNELNPLDGWRLPTQAEWASIIGTIRDGSTVNGSAGKHFCLIKLTGVTHAGSSAPNGLLIFPDGATITGKALTTMDDDSGQTTGVTSAELAEYLAQGCAFLPASGIYYDGDWNYGGNRGSYWSSTETDEFDAYYLDFSASNLYPDDYDSKSVSYYSVRLVRE